MNEFFKKAVEIVEYSPYQLKTFYKRLWIKRKQDSKLRQAYPNTTRKLTVFLVPGILDVKAGPYFTGGIMSIFFLAEESKKVLENSESGVMIATLPKHHSYIRNHRFENHQDVYRFTQIPGYFKQLTSLIIHIPEFTVSSFYDSLSIAERRWLKSIGEVHINVLNQNVRVMPDVETLHSLKELSNKLTVTTAHVRYTNQHYRNLYAVPLHLFSARTSKMEDYIYREWKEKENIIVISPDKHPMREKVLSRLSSIKALEQKVVSNISYEEYKRLISKAKWSLTFGEGLDGYFGESVLCGCIPFAVYNADFFTKDFENLPTVYKSYEGMVESIEEDIRQFDDAGKAAEYNKAIRSIIINLYSDESFRKNVDDFYKGHYTFP